MKKLLLFALLFWPLLTTAQNYQCLQNGLTNYYINGNGYLRAMKMDSVITITDTTLFYPFHTPRGAYTITSVPAPVLDTNGGSWLGKKVTKLNDGTFLFDNYWGNTVTIKSQAVPGDNWILYADSSTLYYKAQVTATDTITILGALDSIKKILITAHNPAGIVATDPLDSMEILLSKNHGFAQVLDLYTFPYHKPDSVYRPGLDFFLDRSTLTYSQISGYLGYAPDKNITLFKLIDFINPNDVQLHNYWNTGDIIERDHQLGTFYYSCTDNYLLDTIVNTTVATHQTTYTTTGSRFSYNAMPPYLVFTSNSITYQDTNYSIASAGYLPERQFNTGKYIFYFPNDTSWCRSSPAYIVRPGWYYTESLGGSWLEYIYKLGMGMVLYNYADGDPTYETNNLVYYRAAGIECGRITWPLAVDDINKPLSTITITPNPATDQLTITASGTIQHITITNILGQQVFTNKYNTQTIQIDISALPKGIYFARINDAAVKKFVKE